MFGQGAWDFIIFSVFFCVCLKYFTINLNLEENKRVQLQSLIVKTLVNKKVESTKYNLKSCSIQLAVPQNIQHLVIKRHHKKLKAKKN